MPLPIAGAQQQITGLAARPANNQAGADEERIVYSPEIHGDADAFRRSDLFPAFTAQYKAELKQVSDLVDEYVPNAVQAHQLKAKLQEFEDHLFLDPSYFSKKSGMMFKGARDQIEELIQHVSSPNMPVLDKQTGLDRALCDIDKCADGLLDNLQSANTNFKYAAQGKIGACKKSINQQVEAHAQAFAKKNHGNNPSYVGNEVHWANSYKNRAIQDHFKSLAPSGDGAINAFSRYSNLDAFSDQVAVSVTPGSVITELADKHYEVLSEVLAKHGLNIKEDFSYDKFTPKFLKALNDDVVTPLTSLLNDEQRQSISPMYLGEAPDGESFTYREAQQKIRGFIAQGMKDGLVELAWPGLSDQAEKIAVLHDGQSIHHEQGVLFSVKSSASEESRGPRINDLKSLDLTGWPAPLMSDLAQQAIGGATSVGELSDFVSQHLTSSSRHMSPRQNNLDKALKSTLMQAVQVKVATDPTLHNETVSQINNAGSAKDMMSLRPLIAMSTQAKVAYVNKAHELGLPITDSIRSYLNDMDILSEAPVGQIVEAFGQGELLHKLFKAAFVGHENGLAKLISVPTININHQDRYGDTPLILASAHGHAAAVEKLAGHPGIDVNKYNEYDMTPLNSAAMNGHATVLEKLLKHPRIDVNRVNEVGMTPLNNASVNGHAAAVQKLLDHNKHAAAVGEHRSNKKVDVNKPDAYQMTPLNSAAVNGHVTVVERLLSESEIELNTPDKNGMTPLNSAAMKGHVAVVETLLNNSEEIKLNTPDKDGVTPLIHAIKKGHAAVVEKLLVKEGIRVNQPDMLRYTPLIHASGRGLGAAVEKLLAHPEILVDEPNGIGFTPLIFASAAGNIEVMEKLLAHPGNDVNKYDIYHFTALHHAIDKEKGLAVEMLVDQKGIDVNKVDGVGTTPLHHACSRGFVAAVEKLLAHPDIDFNKGDNIGETPLIHAIGGAQLAVVEKLLAEPDVDVNKADKSGATPLDHARINGNEAVLNKLLEHPRIDANKPRAF